MSPYEENDMLVIRRPTGEVTIDKHWGLTWACPNGHWRTSLRLNAALPMQIHGLVLV